MTILTPEQLERRQHKSGPALYYALLSLVKIWEDPGPMGVLYAMPRAVSYAKSVLAKIESKSGGGIDPSVKRWRGRA